ncbi:MAG: glycoside hydrolase, partial [Phenylobacterium zucineum]
MAAGAAEGDVEATSAAIAKSIEACAAAGGGRVLVPAGRWPTGAIRLRSRVELHLA